MSVCWCGSVYFTLGGLCFLTEGLGSVCGLGSLQSSETDIYGTKAYGPKHVFTDLRFSEDCRLRQKEYQDEVTLGKIK